MLRYCTGTVEKILGGGTFLTSYLTYFLIMRPASSSYAALALVELRAGAGEMMM